MAFAGIVFLQSGFQKRVQVRLELVQAVFSAEGFVKTEESKDDVRLHLGQPIVGRAKTFGPMAQSHFIGGNSQVAKNQIAVRILIVEISFEPAGMLETVGQTVADEGDMVAGFKVRDDRWLGVDDHPAQQ